MGIEHVTIMTCDRCDKESRYDSYGDRGWESDWASLVPATVAPLGYGSPISSSKGIICESCLTDAERKQLAETHVRLQYDEAFPF